MIAIAIRSKVPGESPMKARGAKRRSFRIGGRQDGMGQKMVSSTVSQPRLLSTSDRYRTGRPDRKERHRSSLPDRRSSAFFLIVAIVLFVPCYSAHAASDTPSGMTVEMHEQFDRVGAIKAAVVAGRLEDVREPADRLATHEQLKFLPYVREMQRHAASASSATELDTAARDVAGIARICGECHRANRIDLGFGYSEPPPGELQSLMTQMQRHLWAADRMWTGLIAPSDAAWKQGAEILAEVRLVPEDIDADPDAQGRIGELMRQLRDVGARAGQATSPELRSHLYGEFLSKCAACHSLAGAFSADR